MNDYLFQRNLIPQNVGITTHTINNGYNKNHKHLHYEFLYVIGGSLSHVLNGEKQILSIGDCCLLTKEDTHELKGINHSVHRDVLISCELFDSICSLISGNNAFPIKVGFSHKILHLSISELSEFEILANNFTNTIDITQKRGLGIELIVKIINKFIDSRHDYIPEHSSIVNKILTLLNKPDALIGGIPSIVEQLQYSKSYVCFIFKKEMGVTLSQYIKTVRLKYIEYYLITTDYSLQQIAELVGIESLSYLNRLFKSKHSVSPIKFRKNHAFSSLANENTDNRII